MQSVEPAVALRWADMAEELAGVGYWWMDASTKVIRWSPNMYRIFGVDPGVVPSLDYAMQFVHPDDRATADSNLARNLSGGSAPSATRILQPSGQIRYVEGRDSCEFAPDGSVLAIYGTVHDVTERIAAEKALTESEARFRLLAEVGTDVVLKIGADAVIQYVSPSISRYGWTPEQMVGEFGARFVHPDDLERVLAGVGRLADGRAVDQPGIDRSYRIRKADGDYAWVETNGSVARDDTGALSAIICQQRDVSDRRRATQALAASEARYRVIADNVTDVISRVGIDAKLIYLSPAIARVTGYAAEELLGLSMVRFIHPEDRSRVLAEYGDMLAGTRRGDAPLIYRAFHKAGHWIWIEASPTIIRDDTGNPVEFLSVTRDVSERVRLQAELQQAAEEATAAAAVKADFLTNMSHELRTPLTAVLGFTDLIEAQTDLSDATRGYVEQVSSAGRALMACINDVLDFSKLEAGQIEIKRIPTSPATLLSDTLGLFAAQAQDKGIVLSVRGLNGLPSGLSLDSDRVRQILLNLIGNAVKFTERGSVVVELTYDPTRADLRVVVTDTGPGIAKHSVSQLFKRFSQIDGSSTRKHGGTGLGLAICKGLTEAMGGEIGVFSEQDQGSSFWFTIPAETIQPLVESELVDSPYQLPIGLRVLIADDNAANRALAGAVFRFVGGEITEVLDGIAAVDASENHPFDVIVMDILMPGMDGVNAARRIREGALNANVPIIAFSSHLGRAPENLFDAVLLKPFTAADLIAQVLTALNEGGPVATAA